METDREFHLPFRQQMEIGATSADDNAHFIIKDYAKWTRTGDSTVDGDPQSMGLLGQQSTDDNCPQLTDVYSQLVNFEFCKIHSVHEEFKVTDYFVRGVGTTGALARNNRPFSKDPESQLLWKLTTNNTEERIILNGQNASSDLGDFMRALPHTRRGVSYETTLLTEMKMLKGIAGRRLLSHAGRNLSPGVIVNRAVISNGTNPCGAPGIVQDLQFNIGNDQQGSNIARHRANLFYWAKGQSYSFGNGQTDANMYRQKYWLAPADNVFQCSLETVTDCPFPRIVTVLPLIEQSIGSTERWWKIQNITTLRIKARGYLPTKLGTGYALALEQHLLKYPVNMEIDYDDDTVSVFETINKH
jgi:hypothetical protein